MQVISNPPKSEWDKILQRPYSDNTNVIDTVRNIILEVKSNGDAALKMFAEKFDGIKDLHFEIGMDQIINSENLLDENLKSAIRLAQRNIEIFHKSQLKQEQKVEVSPGITCWRKSVGMEKVGLYIPGGTAPLFSTVLMLAIPAKLAGCKEIILCSPAGKTGELHPAILFAAKITGIQKVFAIGGAQAIAAMAFGTETIPAASKIFGPGNQYVTAAKQLVQMQGVAIDMPAGPSEVLVICDDSANASFVAADLLSQAEHGADSQVMLASTSASLVKEVISEIDKQIAVLPRRDMAAKSLENSKAFILDNLTDAMALTNAYAPEHLIVCCRNAHSICDQVTNAGSVFIGNFSPESAGDYASGTNHTLPTNGFAKAYSGVSVDSFVKKITFQELTKQGLNSIADAVITMAMEEGLTAHANAVSIRKN
jgi:histidinol dehydrogenase